MELLTLILYIGLEPVKRVLSPFLYPVAYAFRWRLRARGKDTPRLWVKLWEPYLFKPSFLPLWLLLDDSLRYSQGKEYDDNEKRYPGWLWRWAGGEDPEPTEECPVPESFLKAWWWAAIRNSFVNWNNYSAWMLGAYSHTIKRYGGDKNFIEVRVYQGGKIRCYIEFWLFGRWNQIGWLRGNSATNGASRFEIDIMKVKK